MKKFNKLMLFGVLTAGILTGCSDNQDSGAAEEPAVKEEQPSEEEAVEEQQTEEPAAAEAAVHNLSLIHI